MKNTVVFGSECESASTIPNTVIMGIGFRGALEEGEIVFCAGKEQSDTDRVLRFKKDGRILFGGKVIDESIPVAEVLGSVFAALLRKK